MLNLKSGQHVLDVGCGIGGSAFYIAEVTNGNLSIYLGMTVVLIQYYMIFKMLYFKIFNCTFCLIKYFG